MLSPFILRELNELIFAYSMRLHCNDPNATEFMMIEINTKHAGHRHPIEIIKTF